MITPTNVSTISLNRGKYPSHFQVCNAVRIIHISPLVHAYDMANAVAFTGQKPYYSRHLLTVEMYDVNESSARDLGVVQ